MARVGVLPDSPVVPRPTKKRRLPGLWWRWAAFRCPSPPLRTCRQLDPLIEGNSPDCAGCRTTVRSRSGGSHGEATGDGDDVRDLVWRTADRVSEHSPIAAEGPR